MFFSCAGTMSSALLAEGICSCENATGKPVVFGWASTTGGHAFPFAWEHSKFLLKEVSGKLPIYDQSAEKDWHTLGNYFLIKANQVYTFLLSSLSVTLGTLKRYQPSMRFFFSSCHPGREQNPSESHVQAGSFLILLAAPGYLLCLVRGRGLLAATPLFRIVQPLGRITPQRRNWISSPS